MASLQEEIRNYFDSNQITFDDYSGSFDKLEFSFKDGETNTIFYFDAKEKRKKYNMDNWSSSMTPQNHLFIIDDLAARKALFFAPNSGLIIRDNIREQYFLFTVL